MGVGAGGGRPLPQGEGGVTGAIPEKFLKNKDLFTLFSRSNIVISYLVELFIFEWFVQIRAHTWSIFEWFLQIRAYIWSVYSVVH